MIAPTAAGAAPPRKALTHGVGQQPVEAVGAEQDERERRRECDQRREQAAADPGRRVADCGDRVATTGPGVTCPSATALRNCPLGHPVVAVDGVALHQGDDHEAAPEREGPDLQRGPDQRAEPAGAGDGGQQHGQPLQAEPARGRTAPRELDRAAAEQHEHEPRIRAVAAPAPPSDAVGEHAGALRARAPSPDRRSEAPARLDRDGRDRGAGAQADAAQPGGRRGREERHRQREDHDDRRQRRSRCRRPRRRGARAAARRSRSPPASRPGPGSRLVAAIACSNSSSVSHSRRSTHSSRSSAMCTGGPPKPVTPMRPHSRAISRSAGRGGRAAGEVSLAAMARHPSPTGRNFPAGPTVSVTAMRRPILLALALASALPRPHARPAPRSGSPTTGSCSRAAPEAEGAVTQWQRLGVDVVRILVTWRTVAPAPDALDPPDGFVAPRSERLALPVGAHRPGGRSRDPQGHARHAHGHGARPAVGHPQPELGQLPLAARRGALRRLRHRGRPSLRGSRGPLRPLERAEPLPVAPAAVVVLPRPLHAGLAAPLPRSRARRLPRHPDGRSRRAGADRGARPARSDGEARERPAAPDGLPPRPRVRGLRATGRFAPASARASSPPPPTRSPTTRTGCATRPPRRSRTPTTWTSRACRTSRPGSTASSAAAACAPRRRA